MEDENDRNQIDTIALIHPNIDALKAKKALQKQHSIAESIYDGSYILGGDYYLPAREIPSPESNTLRGEQDGGLQSREGPYPEKDDIRMFVKSGEVKGLSQSTYCAQDSITFL